MIAVCYDQLINETTGHPNLAQYRALPRTQEWRQFDRHWPRVVPLRLLMYFNNYTVQSVEDQSMLAWYPIGIGWFDFEFDYFAAMSILVRNKLQDHKLRVLFYYHEGDNPQRIKYRLDKLVERHQLPRNCYTFVSANTAASQLKNFVYFPDHEFFFRHVNRHQPSPGLDRKFIYEFTALSRLHKWWRASIVSDLLHQGLLQNSLISYNTLNIQALDTENDNPIEVDSIPGWRARTRDLANTQLICDQLTAAQQNDHHFVNTDLYTQSRCAIVLETHFDVDQSGGAFLTEKTFKPIKYGQPFVIAGGAGSLQALRDLGYRVFDGVIDNSYDCIENNTQRYLALRDTIVKISNNRNFYVQCLEDLQHNQKIFQQRSQQSVNKLIEDLQCHLQ